MFRSVHIRICLALALICLLASVSSAVQAPAGESRGAIPLPDRADPGLEGPYAAGPPASKLDSWADFSDRHGKWEVLWNEWTGAPQRAVGKAIQISGPIGDAASAHDLALGFLRAERGVTKASPGIDLRERSTVKAGRVWYAHFRQLHEGVEILNSNTTVRLDQDGRVMAFGSDVRDDIRLSTQPLLSADDALLKAREDLYFDFNADQVSGGQDLYVLPLDGPEGSDYALVRHVRVSQASPRHEWETFVDAHSGEIRWRFDRIRYGSVSGDVIGEIRMSTPDDPVITVNLNDVDVNFGANQTTSDALGNYSFPGVSGVETLLALVEGPWADVARVDVANQGQFQTNVDADTNPVVQVDLVAGANPTETNAIYHTNIVHDYVKSLDPLATVMDYSMDVNVNINDSCNAFWNGSSINFFKRDTTAGCNNTIYTADVVYHEYGHGVNDNFYQFLGSPMGMTNGALHEGMADVLANFLQDDSVLGQFFYINNPAGIRDANNSMRYPEDASGEVHNDGEIISGAFWDLREAIGLSAAEQLSHFAKYGLPDGGTKAAFQNYFIETLVADDNDGDLFNGTPNWNDIINSFNLHGIGPSLFLNILHSPIADVPTILTPIPVSALLASTSSLFTLNPATAKFHYGIDEASTQMADMDPTGGDDYEGQIPGMGNGHLVHYWIEAANFDGETLSYPRSAPELPLNFVVGQKIQLSFEDFEGANAWTVNDGTDNATTGIWERVEPFGTFSGNNPVQPQVDNSSPGTLCFVTGNSHSAQDQIGEDDVDGGHTTLLSPIFDLSNTFRPVVRYYRWYSNNSGAAPGADSWRVSISNDGGSSWTLLEDTMNSSASWKRVAFKVENYVTPTNNMRLKFVAEDIGSGSVVEAAVDDVEYLHFVNLGTPAPPARAQSFALSQNEPNPFNPSTEIRFDLPRATRVQLRIYDLAGRLVRTLLDRPMEAGSDQRVVWNGRDQSGRGVSSGVYLYRLRAGDFEDTKRMVLLK